MSIITDWVELSDSLDEDGDAELTMKPDGLSDWEGEEVRYLNADQAKELVNQLNKLFDFEEKDKC